MDDALARSLVEYLDRHRAEVRVELTVRLPGGAKVAVPLTVDETATFLADHWVLVVSEPSAPALPLEKGSGPAPLDATERAIVDALSESADRPTGAQLAQRCGYEFNGRFREALARLVKAGPVVNHHPGYGLPEKS